MTDTTPEVERTRTRRVSIPVSPTSQGQKQQYRYGAVAGEIHGTDNENRPVKILRVVMDDNHREELHEESDTDFCGYRAWIWMDYDSMETPEDCIEALIDYVRGDMGTDHGYWIDATVQDDNKKTKFSLTARIGEDGRARAILKKQEF